MHDPDRELSVIYALTRWPLRSRKELARWCGISEPVFSTIKCSLVRSGVLTESRVAMPNIVGRGVRGVKMGPVGKGTTRKDLLDMIDRSAIEHNVTYMTATDGRAFTILALGRESLSMRGFLGSIELPREESAGTSLTTSYEGVFDVSRDRVHNMADHSGPLQFHSGRAPPPEGPPGSSDVPSTLPPPSLLKLVPYLVGPTVRSEGDIARALGMTRQQVSKGRKELERSGCLRKAFKIDFDRIGMGIFAQFLLYYGDAKEGGIQGHEADLDRMLRPIFWISNGRTAFMQYHFRTLSDLKRFRMAVLSSAGDLPVERFEHLILAGRTCHAVRYSPDLPLWVQCPAFSEDLA